MTGSDLAIIADILEELRMRWPGISSLAKLPNVRSFLSYRLRQAQIKDLDRARFIEILTTKLEVCQ